MSAAPQTARLLALCRTLFVEISSWGGECDHSIALTPQPLQGMSRERSSFVCTDGVMSSPCGRNRASRGLNAVPVDGAVALVVDKWRGALSSQQFDNVLTELRTTGHQWTLRRKRGASLTSVAVDNAFSVDEAALQQHCVDVSLYTEEVGDCCIVWMLCCDKAGHVVEWASLDEGSCVVRVRCLVAVPVPADSDRDEPVQPRRYPGMARDRRMVGYHRTVVLHV